MTAAMRVRAHALIARHGQTVTLARRTAGAYDPATSAASISTATETGKAVILPRSPYADKPDSNIPRGAVQCLLGGLRSDGGSIAAPRPEDRITDANGAIYDIVGVSPLAPAGLPVIYDLTMVAAT